MSSALEKKLQGDGLLGADELLIVKEEQRHGGLSFEQCLLRLGLLSEMELAGCIASLHEVEVVDLERTVPTQAALDMVSADVATRHQVLPVCYNSTTNVLEVAMADPGNLMALDEIASQRAGALNILVRAAGLSRLDQALFLHYGQHDGLPVWARCLSGDAEIDPSDAEVVVVGFMDALVEDAVRERASDLHMEPELGFVRIRYRVDGVLRSVMCVHKRHWPALVVRIKVMAEMDMAEQRRPQDGRLFKAVAGRAVDIRVSTLPTVHGENVVMRLLDRERGIVSFARMGLGRENIDALNDLLLRPDGALLVTGPTGSGKTTTLYAIIDRLNDSSVNVMTLEDPVEYQLPMVRQCALGGGGQFGFAEGTRALLRQDPDVILIGEVRDEQTAAMTMRAAMSGHLVLATLHCGNALGAVPRLVDMGLSPVMLDSCINGVIAQRLVRRLCNNCKEPRQLTEREAKLLGNGSQSVYRARGCAQCADSGYMGRITLMELWRPQPGQCESLANGSVSPHEIYASGELHTLADCGLSVVRQGLSTLEELRRVVYIDG